MDDNIDDTNEIHNLADYVIQANQEEQYLKEMEAKRQQELAEDEARSPVLNGGLYFVDDLGFKVATDIRKYPQRFGEYITFRCMILNPQMYKDGDNIYNQGKRVLPSITDICWLADMPTGVDGAIAGWVYNRLLVRVPTLNRRYIYIGGGAVWDRATTNLVPLSSIKGHTVLKKGEVIGRKDGDTRSRLERYIHDMRDSRRGGKLYSIRND